MKLSIARSELLNALQTASKGMSSRSTLPILAGILIEARDGSLILQATDLEIAVRHSVPALIEDPGQSVIPGKLLTDVVRSLPEAAVSLELEGETLSIRCQQSSFTMKTQRTTDFPKFPEMNISESVSLPADTVSAMVKKVSRAVSRDETRAILTGVLVVVDDVCLRMVATDSYRLAIAEVEADEPRDISIEVVVPARALEEVSRLASSDQNITLGLSENQILFSFGETTFITRKIEGTFPNYKQLLPKEAETTVEVVAEELAAAVKRVSLLAMHNTPLKVSVKADDQTLSLAATTQDVGDASEDLMVKVEGPDVEIAFNHSFLMDGLSAIPSDTALLEIQNALKPGLLRAKSAEKFDYLLMPVRLG